MSKIKNLFSGGNTCVGFYSFYDYMTTPDIGRKFILKGGPGVGKSTFMKKMGQDFSQRGFDIEYHWCSSDSHSLDGVVIGRQKICILDGTAPHIVDPRFPAAVDEIVNLGDFWERSAIEKNRTSIISITNEISRLFQRSYWRLQAGNLAYQEWKSYGRELWTETPFPPEVLADAAEQLPATTNRPAYIRHHFAAAITPQGLVTYPQTLIPEEANIIGLKGQPGSGMQDFFQYLFTLTNLHKTAAEIYHNPLNPQDIDLIVLPENKTVFIDLSGCIVDYGSYLQDCLMYKRIDFDQYLDAGSLKKQALQAGHCSQKVRDELAEAVKLIHAAKELHDELETYYIPSMDFPALEEYRHQLFMELKETL